MIFCAVDIEADQPSNRVIQIGAVIYVIDKTELNIIDTFNVFLDWGIKPNWGHKLRRGRGTLGDLLKPIIDSYDQSKIDHMTAFSDFWNWSINKNKTAFYTQWGSGDLKAIIEQSKIKKYDNSINLKNTYVSMFGPSMGKKKSGLFNTCKKFDIEFEGQNHNAYYDALNTAYLHYEMVKRIT